MSDLHAVPLFLILPVCLAGGFLLGAAYFRALRITADLLVRGGRPHFAMALTLGRVVCLGAVFYVAVLAGGPALLSALAGVLCARWAMLRGLREAQE